MAAAATVPTQTPATEQARKPGGTRSPGATPPPAPLKASQLPIIRLAASLRDSLSSDNGSPPIASRCSSGAPWRRTTSFKTRRTLVPAAGTFPDFVLKFSVAVPRGKIIGKRVGVQPTGEADHF